MSSQILNKNKLISDQRLPRIALCAIWIETSWEPTNKNRVTNLTPFNIRQCNNLQFRKLCNKKRIKFRRNNKINFRGTFYLEILQWRKSNHEESINMEEAKNNKWKTIANGLNDSISNTKSSIVPSWSNEFKKSAQNFKSQKKFWNFVKARHLRKIPIEKIWLKIMPEKIVKAWGALA